MITNTIQSTARIHSLEIITKKILTLWKLSNAIITIKVSISINQSSSFKYSENNTQILFHNSFENVNKNNHYHHLIMNYQKTLNLKSEQRKHKLLLKNTKSMKLNKQSKCLEEGCVKYSYPNTIILFMHSIFNILILVHILSQHLVSYHTLHWFLVQKFFGRRVELN